MHLRRFLPAIMAVVVTHLPAWLPTAQAETALQQLDSLLNDITTLSADVEQLIVESDGGVLEQSQIRLHLKKPDGFYWETITPFPELIVTNGELLWNYQPDLEQVVIENWSEQRSELAAQLLSGNTDDLELEYAIELAEASAAEIVEFNLAPLASDSVYANITISFVDAELDMIHLRHKNGEQTVWRFNAVQRNQQLADSLFEFDPPAGIEVIENTYVD
jgi:outer membrane lipoprotein carrier protein